MPSEAFNKIMQGLEDAKAYMNGEREGSRVTLFKDGVVLKDAEVSNPTITSVPPEPR